MLGAALLRRKCKTRRAKQRTGQRSRSPLRAWPITSPRTEFFCKSNVTAPKVDARISASDADMRSRRTQPSHSCTSLSSKGVDSDFVAVYSPGRSKKKNAIAIMSASMTSAGSSLFLAMNMIFRRTCTGIGFTRFGGGSALL